MLSPFSQAETATIAAASDLRFALNELLESYRTRHPGETLTVVYGSSGKMTTQIINGAPYDLFFSADIRYPLRLEKAGLTTSTPRVYAHGRLVIWHNKSQPGSWEMQDLARLAENGGKIAIAQPRHAPYGQRAKEALQNAGVWEIVEPQLVFGENVAQTAAMVKSGAADAGLIALSLALVPGAEGQDYGYSLVNSDLYQPLAQGYVVTRHGASNRVATKFAAFMETDSARNTMKRYGFTQPANGEENQSHD